MSKGKTVKSRASKKTELFDPDAIATLLHQVLKSDLRGLRTEYASPEQLFYRCVQCRDFLKKYPSEASDQEALHGQALAGFKARLAHLHGVDIPLLSPVVGRTGRNLSYMDRILRVARNLIREILGDLSIDEIFTECRNGPGTTLGVTFQDTSIFAKFTAPFTCTPRAALLWNWYLRSDFLLVEGLYSLNPTLASFPSSKEWITIVPGGRLTTVPKDNTKRRTIAVEPTLNMFFQQGIMAVMYAKMKSFGIDLATLPDRNRTLAYIGSVSNRSFSTIDWQGASDSVLIQLVKVLLPPDWFGIIDMVRSPSVQIEGEWHESPMIGTMGNATTFPIETLVFLSLMYAVIHVERHPWSLVPKWYEIKDRISAFGDDCILPSAYAPQFIEVCSRLGFTVNKDKSFYGDEGFRESCGADWFLGRNVRPIYLGAPHNQKVSSLEPWLYTIANGLLKKYIVYFGVRDYVYHLGFLDIIDWLSREYGFKMKVVPPYFPDDSGLKLGADIWRLRPSMNFDRIGYCKDTKSQRFGFYSFRFCSFTYAARAENDELTQYWMALKQPPGEEEHSPYRKVKRKGGYVVRRGASACWSLGF